MSSIENFVKRRVEDIERESIPEPIRFSVGIDYSLNFRLQHLAKKLDENRASLAARFIELAVLEAEKTLGLNPFDMKSEYSKEFFKVCAGSFHYNETGLFRIQPNGDMIKVADPHDDAEVDYSLGFDDWDNNKEDAE